MVRRICAFIIIFCFIFEQTGFAQVAFPLGVPAYLSNCAPVADKFRPVQLRSIEFDPAGNNFQLLLDKGDLKTLTPVQTEESSQKLFQYFQIGLTLPDSMFWVNLRPDSPDNVIDPYLEKTDLGKVLLEADLQLKKDLARFTNPDTAEGRQYWNKLYAKAEQVFGPHDMEIPTLTRPWIVPGEIILRETPGGAFIYKATLKVMLEQDYIKDSPFFNFDDARLKEINQYSSDLLRKQILPKLTREINSSKRYAALRQVYYSLILAQWFKSKYAGKVNIDQKNLSGLTSKEPWSRAAYFEAYKRSFSEGEYKKEETCNVSGSITVRQYFAGGIMMDGGSMSFLHIIRAAAEDISQRLRNGMLAITMRVTGNVPELVSSNQPDIQEYIEQPVTREHVNQLRYQLALGGKSQRYYQEKAIKTAHDLDARLQELKGKKYKDFTEEELNEFWQLYRDFILSHILAIKMPVLEHYRDFPFVETFNARFHPSTFFSSELLDWEHSLSGVPILIFFDPVKKVSYSVPVDTTGYSEEEVFKYDLKDLQDVINRLPQNEKDGLQLRVGWGNGMGLRGFFLVEGNRLIDYKGYTFRNIDVNNAHRHPGADPTMTLTSEKAIFEVNTLRQIGAVDARFEPIVTIDGTTYGQLRREGAIGEYGCPLIRMYDIGYVFNLSQIKSRHASFSEHYYEAGKRFGQQLAQVHHMLIFNGKSDKQLNYIESFWHAGNVDPFGNLIDIIGSSYKQHTGHEFDPADEQDRTRIRTWIAEDIRRFLVGMDMGGSEASLYDDGFIGSVDNKDYKQAFLEGFIKAYVPDSGIAITATDLDFAEYTIEEQMERYASGIRDYQGYAVGRLKYTLPARLADVMAANIVNSKDGGTTVSLSKAIAALQGVDAQSFPFHEAFSNPRILQDLVDNFQGNPQRLERLPQQAATVRQSVVELIANAIDAVLAEHGMEQVGRFAVGAFQSLALINGENDYVSWTTSTDGKTAVHVKITRKNGEFLLTAETVAGPVRKGTVVELRSEGFQTEEYEAYIRQKFDLTTSMPIYVNGRQVNDLSGLCDINGVPVSGYAYPDARVDIEIDENGFRVIDPGIGMSAQTVLTKLIIPRSGDKQASVEKLTSQQIHEQTSVFYRIDNSKKPSDRTKSRISVRVAGIEIESITVNGYNLPECCVIELPVSTALTTERGFVQIDSQTQEALIAVVEKILDRSGNASIVLLNAVAGLLQSWEQRSKEVQGLARSVRSKIRAWAYKYKDTMIILPSETRLHQHDQDIEGVNPSPDGFHDIAVPGAEQIGYLNDYLFTFDPRSVAGAEKSGDWDSSEGYEVWIVPFIQGASRVFFMHRGLILVNRTYYEKNRDNPAAFSILMNPNNDYVPHGVKRQDRVTFNSAAKKESTVSVRGKNDSAVIAEERADVLLSMMGIDKNKQHVLYYILVDYLLQNPGSYVLVEAFVRRILWLQKNGQIDESGLAAIFARGLTHNPNTRYLYKALLLTNMEDKYSSSVPDIVIALVSMGNIELAFALVSISARNDWRVYWALGEALLAHGRYDEFEDLIRILKENRGDWVDGLRYQQAKALARKGDYALLLRLIETDADNIEACFIIAELYGNAGRSDDERRYLQKARERIETLDTGRIIKAEYMAKLGHLLYLSGNDAEADDAFDKASVLAEEALQIEVSRGQKGSSARGNRSMFEQSGSPTSHLYPSCLCIIAAMLIESRQYERANQLLERALSYKHDIGFNHIAFWAAESNILSVFKTLIRHGKFADVERLLYLFPSENAFLKARINALAIEYANEKTQKRLLAVAANESVLQRAMMYVSYAGALSHKQDISDEERVLIDKYVNDAVTIMRLIDRDSKRNEALEFMSTVLIRSGLFREAEKFIDLIDIDAYKVSLYAEILRARALAEQKDVHMMEAVSTDEGPEAMSAIRQYHADNSSYFADVPRAWHNFIYHAAIQPARFQSIPFEQICPYLTFVEHEGVLALFSPELIQTLAPFIASLTPEEQKEFFALINSVGEYISAEAFSAFVARWSEVYPSIKNKRDIFTAIILLAKEQPKLFESDYQGLDSIGDRAVAMLIRFLRQESGQDLASEESDIDMDKARSTVIERVDPDWLSLAFINAAFRHAPDSIRSLLHLGDVIKVLNDVRAKINPGEIEAGQKQIDRAITGQDKSEHVFLRELIQNSRDAQKKAGINSPIKVRSFIKAARNELAVSVEDSVGMSLATIFGPLLVIDESTKSLASGLSGMFGIGFYTIFADFDTVLIETSLGDNTIYFCEVTKNAAGDFQYKIERRSGMFKGTRIEGIKKLDGYGSGVLENIMITDSLLRYCAAVQDVEIIFNGKKINETLVPVGSVQTEFGTLTLSTNLSGRQRICSNGLYVEAPQPDEYFALVPREYRDIIFNRGFVVELPEKIELTSSRKTITQKEKTLPLLQKAIALASYQALINLFINEGVFPVGLTQDYLAQDEVLVDASVSDDIALIHAGLFDQVDFTKYVILSEDDQSSRIKKNERVIQFITLIRVRTADGQVTSFDDIRQQLIQKRSIPLSHASDTFSQYVSRARELIEVSHDFTAYTQAQIDADKKLSDFQKLGMVTLTYFGLGGIINVGLGKGGDAVAFLKGNTIFFNLEKEQKMVDRFSQILEEPDGATRYDFFRAYLNDIAHEAAHLDSGSHESETLMEGVFGWYKARTLNNLILTGKNLDELVEEVKKDNGNGVEATKDGGTIVPRNNNKTVAGIDFRTLPVTAQRSAAQTAVDIAALTKLADGSGIKDMDAEWVSILKTASKQIPYGRIKQYWAVCCTRSDAQGYKMNVINYVTRILLLEEEQAISTKQELKDLLACIG